MVWEPYVAYRTRRKIAFRNEVDRLVMAQLGTTVQAGPFTGLQHIGERPGGGPIGCKVIGCFEEELHDTLAALPSRGYTCVMNVGCAEGYYVAGLARLLPEATVYAYDIDEEAIRMSGRMSEVNGVADRVIMRGLCDHAELEATLEEKSLVFMDCEGCELDLLDPSQAPTLQAADILVETHDFVNPAISATIRERFAATHHIVEMPSRSRDPNAYPAISFLSPAQRTVAVFERNEANRWFFMTPLSRPAAA